MTRVLVRSSSSATNLCLLLLIFVAALLPLSTTTSCKENGNNNNDDKSCRSTAFQINLPPPTPPPTIMRAWNCHGRNQRDLVDRLMQAKIVQSPAVREVMNQVDRQYYVPNNPYLDSPQAIGLGQTISAPHMHAHVLEEMLPYLQKEQQQPSNDNNDEAKREVKVLDVGCGSGYLTACLGRWVKPRDGGVASSDTTILGRTGQVYGIDIYQHLVDLSKRNMMAADADLLSSNTVKLQVANGWKGLPEAAPFDAIHVGAAAADFPRALAAQLRVGGVLIVPVGPVGGVQNLYKVERVAGHPERQDFVQADYRVTELLGVRYVPLVQGPVDRNTVL